MADDALLALVCPPLDYYCRALNRAFGAWGTDEAAPASSDADLEALLQRVEIQGAPPPPAKKLQ